MVSTKSSVKAASRSTWRITTWWACTGSALDCRPRSPPTAMPCSSGALASASGCQPVPASMTVDPGT
ncbi:MAG: hypothetical protein DI597_12580 [Pseudoxanthomonas spadix]|nr:MAG: hypothetical protein DI597_12580 [Pseudoxanthomonas spadix]